MYKTKMGMHMIQGTTKKKERDIEGALQCKHRSYEVHETSNRDDTTWYKGEKKVFCCS